LDSVRPAAGTGTTTALAALFYPLYALPGPSIAPATTQLSPASYGDALTISRDGAYQMTDAIGNQIAARRGGITILPETAGSHGLTIWVTGIGASSRVNSGVVPGFSGTIGGGAVGADKVIAPGVIAGLAIGGLSTSASARDGSQASGNLGQFTAYGGWQQGIVFADGQATVGIGNQDVHRPLVSWGTGAQGSTIVKDVGAQFHAGVHLLTAGFVVEPMVGLSVLTLSDSRLTELTATGLAERIAGAATTSVRSLLGVRVGHTFVLPAGRPLTVDALAGWEHEFGDTSVRQDASFGPGGRSFRVDVAPESRDRARLGAGMSLALSDRISLFGAYDASVAASSTVQRMTGGARLIW
jgi:outer membrane autotransporter protein